MAEQPRNEYPRPQFQRESWLCLNGEWDFAFDPGDSGADRELFREGAAYPEQILVPFAPESSLSGIGRTDFMPAVWYRRAVELTSAQAGGRVLLHFGAVDYRASVWVNGSLCGTHEGGYTSFAVEITHALRAGRNTIVVRAQDDGRHGRQPRGKQCETYASQGCDYTRTTGIWQTVWLEFVPQTYLKRVRVTADDKGLAVFDAQLDGGEEDLELRTALKFRGVLQAQTGGPVRAGHNLFSVSVPQAQLWSPESPNLYEIEYRLLRGEKTVDLVRGYSGFRSVSLNGRALCLNGKPRFQRLVLDQGFYPDGIYTAPDDASLRADIEHSMRLGFNGARLHQKVFEERFLYWADRLGYLVWGEFGNGGLDISGPEGLAVFLPQWLEAVERDENHPCVIGWCPFNETWDYRFRRQDDRVLETVYETTRRLDATRPVIDTSGHYHVRTDLYDMHDYEQDPHAFAAHYGTPAAPQIFELYGERQKYEGQPYWVSEYGGVLWDPEGKGWGYGQAPRSEEEAAERIAELTRVLLRNPLVCGFCYTQLYDVEQERNGLLTYRRQKKFREESYQKIRSALTVPAAIEASGNPENAPETEGRRAP